MSAVYRQLDPDSIIKTVRQLHRRIEERFSGRGITDVCAELVAVTEGAKAQAIRLNSPNWPLRALIGALIGAGGVVFVYIGTFLNFSKLTTEAFGLVQGLEASINTAILAGIGIAFLANAERRRKRKRALQALHEIRSLAHVIDMHQLTKDPNVLLRGGPKTASSPERTMDEFLLTRYLDYCTEMLSICGKVAALYAQYFKDPVVVNAVNEIELLSTNLSRKIWQKIMLMNRQSDGGTSPDEIKSALMSVAGKRS